MSILIKKVILDGERKDIFVEENKIKKIGKTLNLKAKEKIDGKGEKAAFPGLINCHTHAAMALFRGYADDLPLKEWLENRIWPLEAKLNEDDVYWGIRLAILEMIKTGTTCFNDMYWYAEASVSAVKETGIRAKIGLPIIDFDQKGTKEIVEKTYNHIKIEKIAPIELVLAPHALYTVSKENLIWAKNFAKKNNLLLHIHLSETEKEVKDCRRKNRLRPVEYLEKIGFLAENCILAHSIWLSDKEIEILRKRKCSLVSCSVSNMKLASGIFPYKKVKTAGINICLGTDGAASNNNLDLFEEMKFASLLQKTKEKNPAFLEAKEVFTLATKNGAEALKINSGEIETGKLADLILIDLNQACLAPGHNFISDLVYSCSGNCVSDVICNGKILMREKKVEGAEKIIREAKKRAKAVVEK